MVSGRLCLICRDANSNPSCERKWSLNENELTVFPHVAHGNHAPNFTSPRALHTAVVVVFLCVGLSFLQRRTRIWHDWGCPRVPSQVRRRRQAGRQCAENVLPSSIAAVT